LENITFVDFDNTKNGKGLDSQVTLMLSMMPLYILFQKFFLIATSFSSFKISNLTTSEPLIKGRVWLAAIRTIKVGIPRLKSVPFVFSFVLVILFLV
jgi:hypothetical protein